MRELASYGSALALLSAPAVVALFAACDGKVTGSTVFFVPHSTSFSVRPDATIRVSGRWLVFQADEATSGPNGAGENENAANGDTDTNDSIGVVVNMLTQTQTVTHVAVNEIAILKNEIYFAVDEAEDHFDWNGDGAIAGRVLVHTPNSGSGRSSPAAPDVEYVDDLEPSGSTHLVEVDGRLYYTRPDSRAWANGDTSLAWIDPLEPTTPTTITSVDLTSAHRPRIVGADEQLLILAEDETVDGVDRNGDGDALDPAVLALLDGTDPASKLRSVQLAIRDLHAPYRAKSMGKNDWIVGFLVDEAAQDDFPNGLNDLTHLSGFDAASLPENCPTYDDTDRLDQVLHYLNFKSWNADPLSSPPQNTGVPGRERVLCLTRFVATIVDEGDESSGTGGCDLNGDGDTSDRVLRWVRTVDPKHPYPYKASLCAVADDTPGGAFGVTDLDDKLLAVVDEAQDGRDHDGNAANNRLLGWMDPSNPSNTDLWIYDHSTSATLYFGTTWLADSTPRFEPRLAVQESVFAQNAGKAADAILGNADKDTKDCMGAITFFGSTNDLDFIWPKVAVKPENPGVAVYNNAMFVRIDEASDEKDWDGNHTKDGAVLLALNFLPLGTLNALQRPAVEGGGNTGVAWIADEAMAHADFDHNGSKSGFVVRWCRIGN